MVYQLLNQEFMKDLKVAIMPDCHEGKGCVIGTTIEIKDKIVPNLVGVDIGCGMLIFELGNIEINYELLDNFIRENIPSGKNVYDKEQKSNIDLSKMKCYDKLNNKKRFLQSMGTLGGGNHFIEIDKDDDNNKYLVIHTGSRNLGVKVCDYYQERAISYQKDKVFNKEEERRKIISSFKEASKEKEIQKALNHLKTINVEVEMPLELCFLEGKLFDDYLYDMAICQEFAVENRMRIAEKILYFLKINKANVTYFESIHNYINMNDMILRKGAISAREKERVLIPINMRDGCILGSGKGNKDYNFSAPHGAGRVLSRSDAKKRINMEDYKKSMEGIYTTSVTKDTIDESPFAYKSLKDILDNILETVNVEKIIKPVYNFKESE